MCGELEMAKRPQHVWIGTLTLNVKRLRNLRKLRNECDVWVQFTNF